MGLPSTDYTAQEYFDSIRASRFPGGPTDIATAWLTYLSFNVFAEGCCLTDEAFENRLQQILFSITLLDIGATMSVFR